MIYWLFRSLPPHSMVRATMVVLSWLVRVIPVQAFAGSDTLSMPAKAKIEMMDGVFMVFEFLSF